MNNYSFTSESVTEGHPDKVSDLISDAIADYIIDNNKAHRAAIETLVTTNMVTIAGEYKSSKEIDKVMLEKIARDTVRSIGYDQEGFSWKNLKFYSELHGQSPDIALGTDNFGAGDQGLMFGYACDETESMMPSPIHYSHQITKALADARHKGVSWLGPDGKAQITFTYSDINNPIGISNVVCSTQHAKDMLIDDVRDGVKDIITTTMHKHIDSNTEFMINPTGRFVVGGPQGDCGLTGRKIIVDTYGGAAPHGGGAFSGKDPTKVDRSAAYAARYVAKNIVASGLADKCLVQVSYAIGVAKPTSIMVESFGTAKLSDDELSKIVMENFDLRPKGIVSMLDLLRPIYRNTAAYGHFGRTESTFSWEKIDKKI